MANLKECKTFEITDLISFKLPRKKEDHKHHRALER